MAIRGPKVPIRELRRAHALTLVDLAERIAQYGIDVHPDTLSNIELGRRRGSQPLMYAWAKALNVRPLDVEQRPELADAS